MLCNDVAYFAMPLHKTVCSAMFKRLLCFCRWDSTPQYLWTMQLGHPLQYRMALTSWACCWAYSLTSLQEPQGLRPKILFGPTVSQWTTDWRSHRITWEIGKMAADTRLRQCGLWTSGKWRKDRYESLRTETLYIPNCSSIGQKSFTSGQNNLMDKTVDFIFFLKHHEPWQATVVLHHMSSYDALSSVPYTDFALIITQMDVQCSVIV